MKMMECKECGVSFNLFSQEKKKAGGLIFNCADCAEEQHIKYAGVQSADGKQSQATILKFKSNEDK